MRYTLPWFLNPSKRVAQTPGAAVTDHQTGLHADAFAHRSRADSRRVRAHSRRSQVAQDLADIRTRGEICNATDPGFAKGHVVKVSSGGVNAHG
eukprot:1932790-Prymnesium_polylepis.1